MSEPLELDHLWRRPRAVVSHRVRQVPPASSSLQREFAGGDDGAIAAATALVTRVVAQRGYFIPPDDRPDVIQETMVDLVEALRGRTFGSDAEFSGFVRTVSYRRCVDWIRKNRKREPLRPRILEAVDPDHELLAKERRLLAGEVVSRLGDPCRELLSLHVLGSTYAELAAQFDRSEGALRTKAYECLKQARLLLERLQRRRKLSPVRSSR
jgi:RNA polymerase sigma factor (sigma-70 family)